MPMISMRMDGKHPDLHIAAHAAIMDHAEDVADILPKRQTEFRKSMEK
jgi:hypothetical protein